MKLKSFFITFLFFISSFIYAENNLLYNISNANVFDENNYLIEHNAYVLSYNNDKCIANWVSWHLDKLDIGNIKRNNSFKVDPLLPDDFCKATSNDYKKSGYDRGHQCPSKDRSSDKNLNQETFYMTNILPQIPKLNQQTWKNFEEYLRNLVINENKEIYIYSGGLFGNKKIKNKIIIPDYYFKIAIILENGNFDMMRINDADIICVLMPNKNNISNNWKEYIVPLSKIKELARFELPVNN